MYHGTLCQECGQNSQDDNIVAQCLQWLAWCVFIVTLCIKGQNSGLVRQFLGYPNAPFITNSLLCAQQLFNGIKVILPKLTTLCAPITLSNELVMSVYSMPIIFNLLHRSLTF